MVTISTTSEDKTSNCVVTPKKKQMASTASNQTSSSTSGTVVGNSTSSSSNTENNSDQMAPNILVYKKVSGTDFPISMNIHMSDGLMCTVFIFRRTFYGKKEI